MQDNIKFEEVVVDLSYHQGEVDFEELKNSGVYGVIIRAGYGDKVSQEDPMFQKYYEQAKEVGLHIGAYWYSYAQSPSDTRQEIQAFLQVVEGKDFDMFLAYDVEDVSQLHLDQDTTSWMCETALNMIGEHGYTPVLYTNPDWLTYHLSYVEMAPDTNYWVAAYDEGHEEFTNSDFCVMHQYKISEPSRGISTNYDLNVCYVDFPNQDNTDIEYNSNTIALPVDAEVIYNNEVDDGVISPALIIAMMIISFIYVKFIITNTSSDDKRNTNK